MSCDGFQFLNSLTVQQASATIPNITEIFSNLHAKIYFCVFDHRNAYHRVDIYEEHLQYTAFQNVDGQILHVFWVGLCPSDVFSLDGTCFAGHNW